MVEYRQITTTSYALTEEGLGIAASGSHEYRVWGALPAKGGEPVGVPELKVGLDCYVTLSLGARCGAMIRPPLCVVRFISD